MFLSEDQIENSYGRYIRGKPETVPFPELIEPIDRYRKHVTQRFITRREQDIPNLYGKKFFTSIKVDGAFSGYYYNEFSQDSIFFNVPTHRVFLGLPVCEDLAHLLKEKGIKVALIVGELIGIYGDPIDFDKRSRIYHLIKFRRNPQTQEDLERIGFRAFDIIELDGIKWINKDFKDRFRRLQDIFPDAP